MAAISVLLVLFLILLYVIVFYFCRKDVGFPFDYFNRRVTPRVILLFSTVTTIVHKFSDFDCEDASDYQEGRCYRAKMYFVNFTSFPVGKKFTELHSISYYGAQAWYTTLHLIPALIPYFVWRLLMNSYHRDLCDRLGKLADQKKKPDEKVVDDFIKDFHNLMKKKRLRLLPAFLFVRFLQISFNWFQILIIHWFYNLSAGWEMMHFKDLIVGNGERTAHFFPETALCPYFPPFLEGGENFKCHLGNNPLYGNIIFLYACYFWLLAVTSSVHFLGSLLFWSFSYTREAWPRKLWQLSPRSAITSDLFMEKYLRADGLLLVQLIEAHCEPSVVVQILETSMSNYAKDLLDTSNP